MYPAPQKPTKFTERVSGWVDQAIGVLSPSWAADRQIHRHTQELMYRAARHSRLDRKKAREGSADNKLEQGEQRRRMVDRARQLERDSVLADALLSRSQEYVVGPGFKLQAKTASDSFNEAAEALWNTWAGESKAADVRGMSTFGELLSLALRSYLRDGDVGAIQLSDGKLQMVESDQLSSPFGSSIPTRKMIDGVELDDRGKPVAYHVVDKPDPINTSVRFQFGRERRTRVPADQFIFLTRRKRIGQTRGVSAFSPVAWLLDEMDGNIEAVTAAARMAACVGLVIASKRRMAGLPTEQGSDGQNRRKLTLEPGMIKEVAQDAKVTQIDPKQPTQNFPEFLRTLARLASASFGVPVEIALLNFEKSNFSNARTALMQAWQVWTCLQLILKGFSTRVYNWKMIEWMRAGLLPVREDALEHEWTAPGWKWIDPTKEIQATMAGIDAGLDSEIRAAKRLGLDFFELLEERKLAAEAREAAGLPEVRSTLTRDPAAPAADEPEDKPDDDDDEPEPEGDDEGAEEDEDGA